MHYKISNRANRCNSPKGAVVQHSNTPLLFSIPQLVHPQKTTSSQFLPDRVARDTIGCYLHFPQLAGGSATSVADLAERLVLRTRSLVFRLFGWRRPNVMPSYFTAFHWMLARSVVWGFVQVPVSHPSSSSASLPGSRLSVDFRFGIESFSTSKVRSVLQANHRLSVTGFL